MICIDDTSLNGFHPAFEIVRPVGRRRITAAFHDIDGTHSCIRDWSQAMSTCLHSVIKLGLPDDFDAPRTIGNIVEAIGSGALPETDRFCEESAGLSALTQMEWGIRRGIQQGTVSIPGFQPDAVAHATNARIIHEIENGRELFEFDEAPALRDFLQVHVPRLLRMFERILDLHSRDRNFAAALRDPGAWRIPGSLEFMQRLHQDGVKNFFVTGAIVTPGVIDGIHSEVLALEFEIGPGKMVEGIHGSRPNTKLPKSLLIQGLCRELDLNPAELLIIGDGRAEIAVGVELGAVTVSRLSHDHHRQRDLHRRQGTNYIIADYLEFPDVLMSPAEGVRQARKTG